MGRKYVNYYYSYYFSFQGQCEVTALEMLLIVKKKKKGIVSKEDL